MLAHLTIRNLAIVEELTLDLGPGMNVLTGETGAGKSVLVDALALALGARARKDTIRRGCEQGGLEAHFILQGDHPVAEALRDAELSESTSDDEVDLLIRRELAVGRSGRTSINGHLVTLGTLRRITSGLMDIASQHQHVSLRDRGAPLNLLDHIGDGGTRRCAYGKAWAQVQQAREELKRLQSISHERMEREDFVRFLLEELDEATLVPGEDATLRERQTRLTHADSLIRGLTAAEALLSTGTTSVSMMLTECLKTLSPLTDLDPSLLPLSHRIDTARIEIEDVAYDLATQCRGTEGSPGELERVQGRLHQIERLTRKHRVDLPALLEKRESLRRELADLQSMEEALSRSAETLEQALQEARQIADTLSKARQKAARRLSSAVDTELEELGMSGARIRFGITVRDQPGPDGLDDVVLLAQTNPGEGFKPIERIASGGELSRLLLAFKGALTHRDPVCTSVFDEIDTGVGGPTAEVMGKKLKTMASRRQILVVTHQPQIAMHAHHHLHVQKGTHQGRTVTGVTALNTEERRDELSRMLGGATISAQARQHAAELLARGAAA